MTPDRMRLPQSLYTAEGVRRLDRAAIEGCGIAGMTLMERAGAAAFAVLGEHWPAARRLAVVCGAGNNAGDGYVVARLAHAAGLAVTVLECAEHGRLKGDARTAAEAAMAAGIVPQAFDAALLPQHDLIVDALLGTGLAREVGGAIGLCIETINGSGVPVLAIDLPSGLHADTGSILGRAVIAEATITFIGVKQGLLTGAGPDHCGRLYHDDLGVPAAVYRAVDPSAERLDLSRWSAWLRPRRRSAHKGHFGHVLVVGGGDRLCGRRAHGRRGGAPGRGRAREPRDPCPARGARRHHAAGDHVPSDRGGRGARGVVRKGQCDGHRSGARAEPLGRRAPRASARFRIAAVCGRRCLESPRRGAHATRGLGPDPASRRGGSPARVRHRSRAGRSLRGRARAAAPLWRGGGLEGRRHLGVRPSGPDIGVRRGQSGDGERRHGRCPERRDRRAHRPGAVTR